MASFILSERSHSILSHTKFLLKSYVRKGFVTSPHMANSITSDDFNFSQNNHERELMLEKYLAGESFKKKFRETRESRIHSSNFSIPSVLPFSLCLEMIEFFYWLSNIRNFLCLNSFRLQQKTRKTFNNTQENIPRALWNSIEQRIFLSAVSKA